MSNADRQLKHCLNRDNDPFGRDSYRIKEREPGKKIKKNS